MTVVINDSCYCVGEETNLSAEVVLFFKDTENSAS
jgi:hypothetical protein